MIVDGDGNDLFGVVLADDVFIEEAGDLKGEELVSGGLGAVAYLVRLQDAFGWLRCLAGVAG